MLKSVIHAPMLLKGWFLYLILFPFYFFKAGQPQISDYFIALVLISLVFQGKLTNLSAFKSILSGFRNLVLYIGIVNIGLAIATFGVTTKGIAWYFVLAFYVFNFLIFNFAFYLYLKYKKMFLQVSLAGIILSCAVPILL